jgi:hypothetical protein
MAWLHESAGVVPVRQGRRSWPGWAASRGRTEPEHTARLDPLRPVPHEDHGLRSGSKTFNTSRSGVWVVGGQNGLLSGVMIENVSLYDQ